MGNTAGFIVLRVRGRSMSSWLFIKISHLRSGEWVNDGGRSDGRRASRKLVKWFSEGLLSGLESGRWTRLAQWQVGNRDEVSKRGGQDGAPVSGLGSICGSH